MLSHCECRYFLPVRSWRSISIFCLGCVRDNVDFVIKATITMSHVVKWKCTQSSELSMGSADVVLPRKLCSYLYIEIRVHTKLQINQGAGLTSDTLGDNEWTGLIVTQRPFVCTVCTLIFIYCFRTSLDIWRTGQWCSVTWCFGFFPKDATFDICFFAS